MLDPTSNTFKPISGQEAGRLSDQRVRDEVERAVAGSSGDKDVARRFIEATAKAGGKNPLGGLKGLKGLSALGKIDWSKLTTPAPTSDLGQSVVNALNANPPALKLDPRDVRATFSDLAKVVASKSGPTTVHVSNLTLPSVTNATEFIEDLNRAVAVEVAART